MQRRNAVEAAYDVGRVLGLARRDRAIARQLTTTAPLSMFLGAEDEEVSPDICERVAERSTSAGTDIAVMVYRGATHDFDDPGERRQSIPDNQAARADAMARAAAVIDRSGKP
jgi:dienelactone hydrolase